MTLVRLVDLDGNRLCSHADIETLLLACGKLYHGCILL